MALSRLGSSLRSGGAPAFTDAALLCGADGANNLFDAQSATQLILSKALCKEVVSCISIQAFECLLLIHELRERRRAGMTLPLDGSALCAGRALAPTDARLHCNSPCGAGAGGANSLFDTP